jgi:hypothetical protein
MNNNKGPVKLTVTCKPDAEWHCSLAGRAVGNYAAARRAACRATITSVSLPSVSRYTGAVCIG